MIQQSTPFPVYTQMDFANTRAIVGACFALLLASACTATGSGAKSASPTPASSVAAGYAEEDYRISPEDILDISVWKEPELQNQVVVRPDGGISFPLVGNVQAAGKTTTELRAELTKAISEFVPSADVSVSIVEIKGLKIFVTGKVRNPGQFLVGRYVDVLQALTLAGGLSTFADGKNVRVLRRTEGRETVFRFNYTQVEKGESMEQNILLQPGDTIIVP